MQGYIECEECRGSGYRAWWLDVDQGDRSL